MYEIYIDKIVVDMGYDNINPIKNQRRARFV